MIYLILKGKAFIFMFREKIQLFANNRFACQMKTCRVKSFSLLKLFNGYGNRNSAENLPGKFVLFLLGLILAGLMGCAPKTQTVSVPVDTTEVFSGSGNQETPEKWWIEFNNEKLNLLVDSAITSNFSLKSAWQRLQASRAVVDRESSSFWPTLESSAQGESSKYQTQYVQNQSFQLGLRSSYEVDMWGKIRSRVEAERYRAKASLNDYQTAALSLSAEIVRTWYQLIEAQNQVSVVNEQIKTNEEMLKLIEARFGSGQIRSADILRQRRLLESTREQRITAQTRVGELEHKLAVLLGNPPQEEVNQLQDSLPELPPVPETGVPAELIRRRPDVQSVYNRLQAADREVAAAISSQYPRFSISASASTSANSVDDLFKDWARSLSGNLLAPLFYGGRLRAEVDRSEAIKKQRLYEYGQTILNAFREVEDALMLEEKQREKIQSIRKQVDISRQTYEQLRVQYFNGFGGYLDVLTALDELQQLRRNLLSAHLQLLEYRVALYRSLAGGFETARESNNEQ